MIPPADWAFGALGYQFQDAGLLELALTHRSAAGGNNERLEFLGDAVLGLAMSEALYASHPEADEGTLSRLRARLVRRETLEELARELALGDLLRLGPGELRSGGHRRASILANSLEAVLGAVFLDGGWRVAEEVILRLMSSRLASLDSGEDLRDPKTRLQEFLQARKKMLPSYELRSVEGEGHAQTFVVDCHIDGLSQAVVGSGSSRRRAEQEAASQALQVLDHG